MRSRTVVWLLLAMAGVPLAWDEAGGAPAQRAVLQLSLNEISWGDILVYVREGDVLAPAADLERVGVGRRGQRDMIDGVPHVSLASLAPAVTYEIDEASLALRLTAQPSILPPSTLDLAIGPPPGMIHTTDTSAFLNYALGLRNGTKVSAFSEAGVSIAGAFVYASATYTEDGTFVRGLTSITVDDRRRLQRWVAGDRLVSSGLLGSAVVMGGISFSRDFSLDPYFIRFPGVGLAGAVELPSTADIYVNGQLVRRHALAPGPFDLRNLPVAAGAGTTRVVLKDPFGREQVISAPFYFATNVLAAGVQDYTYNLGFVRRNLATDSWDYGRLGFLGAHRVGLTDRLTLGARLEASPSMVSGGPVLAARTPLGEFDVGAAASVDRGRGGGALSAGYQYSGRVFGFGGIVRATTDHYATLMTEARDDRATIDAAGFVGATLGPRASATVQYTHRDFRDLPSESIASLFATVNLTSSLNLFLSASRRRQQGGEIDYQGSAGVSYFLGDYTTASAAWEHRPGGSRGVASIQRSLPIGEGWGYLLEGSLGEESAYGQVGVSYQGPWGRYEASYRNTDGKSEGLLTIAGGIVALGGEVMATRPVTDAFALIQVPGVEGVTGQVNMQDVGRTNSRGNLVVPNLLPYYGNRVSIADRDIPIDYAVGEVERVVAPPSRGGAVVRFPVEKRRAITGKVVVERAGKTRVPTWGQLQVKAGTTLWGSPLGKGGAFYLENVPAGRHPATVEDKEGSCKFVLEIPASSGRAIDLGTLRCVASPAAKRASR